MRAVSNLFFIYPEQKPWGIFYKKKQFNYIITQVYSLLPLALPPSTNKLLIFISTNYDKGMSGAVSQVLWVFPFE